MKRGDTCFYFIGSILRGDYWELKTCKEQCFIYPIKLELLLSYLDKRYYLNLIQLILSPKPFPILVLR